MLKSGWAALVAVAWAIAVTGQGCDDGPAIYQPPDAELAVSVDAADAADAADSDSDGTAGDDGAADAPGDTDLDAPAVDVPTAPFTPLRVATWNIEQFPKNSYTIQKVADAIVANDYHVVAVQEVADPAGFTELLGLLDGYDGQLNDDAGGFIRVGLLYKTSRVRMDWHATAFTGEYWEFPRPPLVAGLTALRDDGSDGFDFVSVVLHLKAQVDPESEGRRRQACQKLDMWLGEQLAFGAEKDYVLLGDWNDKLEDPPEWNVFTALTDKPDAYTFLTLPSVQAGDISYLPFPGMIDHIMVTNDALDELAGGVTVVERIDLGISFYREDVSDHVPVVTTFNLTLGGSR